MVYMGFKKPESRWKLLIRTNTVINILVVINSIETIIKKFQYKKKSSSVDWREEFHQQEKFKRGIEHKDSQWNKLFIYKKICAYILYIFSPEKAHILKLSW